MVPPVPATVAERTWIYKLTILRQYCEIPKPVRSKPDRPKPESDRLMARIKFIQIDGKEKEVVAKAGESVMRAAVDNGVEGIAAECGGCLSCATCHAYISEEWADRVPPPSEEEKVMIECAMGVQANSRLTCQLTVTDELDGLVVQIPPTQY